MQDRLEPMMLVHVGQKLTTELNSKDLIKEFKRINNT